MGRFLLLLVTRRWGWTLIAALIVAGGSLWGVSSPTIPYQNAQNTTYITAAASNGDVYFWTTDNSNFFVARHDDFNPPIDRTKLHLDAGFNFVARTDTISVNDTVASLHITQAHVIEQLVLYDNTRNVVATYITSDYNANPNGYYANRWWPTGIGIIFVGLLLAYVVLFVGRKRRAKVSPGSQPPSAGSPPYAQSTPFPAPGPNAYNQNPPQP